MVDRDLRLNIRLSAEEREMLYRLAENAGISISDFLRLHIRNAHAEVFGSERPPKKKSTK